MSSPVKILVVACSVLFSLVLPTHAQTSLESDLILFPLHITHESAYGARWNSRLSVFSRDEAIRIRVPICVPIGCGEDIVAVPGEERVIFSPLKSAERPGLLARVEKGKADTLKFSSLLINSPKSPPSLTRIPVVRERDLSQDYIQLLSVPRQSGYRHNLRIYDVDSRPNARVVVRFYDVFPRLFTEVEVDLINSQDPNAPGFAQIDQALARFGLLSDDPTRRFLRVEVQSLTPGLRFWAFMTVVTEATQEVLVISP